VQLSINIKKQFNFHLSAKIKRPPQALFLESRELKRFRQVFRLAPSSKLPSRPSSEQWIKYRSKTFDGAYGSGSVQDSRLIPFSTFPERESITKIDDKGKKELRIVIRN
jgi:hypothetical protein